jgi:cobalt-zinc-cadmium efflux system protein
MMGHDHDHLHAHAAANDADGERRLFRALLITGGFMAVEAIGGVLSGSLALLADAGHMFGDFIALALA